MMRINFHRNWNKLANRLERVAVKEVIDRSLTLWGADMMVKEAQEQLDKLVYLAPPPPSARGHEAKYLQENRTNLTRKAVRRERLHDRGANVAAAQAKVDKSFYPGYFYARVLNFGGKPGGRLARYKKRPFWTNAATVVKAAWKARGVVVQAEIIGDLRKD